MWPNPQFHPSLVTLTEEIPMHQFWIDYLGNNNQVLFRLYREYQFEISCESYHKASILFFNKFMLK